MTIPPADLYTTSTASTGSSATASDPLAMPATRPETSSSTLANSTRPLQAGQDMSSTNTSNGHPPKSAAVRRPRNKVVAWCEKAALNTPPSFFAMNMGTGIASILLHNFPYNARWLEYLGIIVFVLNIVLFVCLLAATMARFVFWRGVWDLLQKHTVSSMFWGCFPMGFVTIVNMICFVCVPAWGKFWAYFAYALWWLDVLVSVVVSLGMLFVMFTRQTHTDKTLAPTWLLPIVSCVVAAASGAVVSDYLMPYDVHLARSTLLVSYVIWGIGVPLAMMVIALLIYRLAIGGPPAAPALASVFLPLGPCGQGSYGIINMGIVARKLAYQHGISIVPGVSEVEGQRIADVLYAGGLVTGLIMWGLALAWYLLGVAMFMEGAIRDRKLLGIAKFTPGLWALTFPLGVFATSTISLAAELGSPAFKVLAAFLSAQVIFNWVYVAIFTFWKMCRDQLFVAPELAGIEDGLVGKRWEKETFAGDIEAGYGEPEAERVAAQAAAPTIESREKNA